MDETPLRARILIVSDDEHTREELVRMVRDMPNDHAVVGAAGPERALMLLPGVPPAKVVLVHHTETLDAVALLLQFAENCPPAVRMLVVDPGSYDTVVRAINASTPQFAHLVFRVIAKPFNRDEVLRFVGEAVVQAGKQDGTFLY